MKLTELSEVNKPANEGVWVSIKHPLTKEVLPIRFKIIGATSDRFYKLRDELQSEALASDTKEIDSFGLRLVAGMVVDIEGLEDENGQPMKDAMKVFKTEGMRFIFEQLNVEVSKRANFMQPA